MEIFKSQKDTALTVALSGRLDTTTAPQLEGELKSTLRGVTELILDFTKLEYISSAGLRVLLGAQKEMNRRGSMKLIGVCDTVKEVFDITGFSDILTIE